MNPQKTKGWIPKMMVWKIRKGGSFQIWPCFGYLCEISGGIIFWIPTQCCLPVKHSFQPRVTRTHATPSEGSQSNHALVHSSHLKGCTQKTTLHPGRLTWNLKMMVWKMIFRISIGCFLGSMLIFRGVVPTNKLQELVKLRKTKQENSHTLQRTGANQFTPESQWKRLSRSIPLAFWGVYTG